MISPVPEIEEAIEPYGRWLKRRMEERRWTQRKLAYFSGVSHTTISRILSDPERDVMWSTVRAIGRAFEWPE